MTLMGSMIVSESFTTPQLISAQTTMFTDIPSTHVYEKEIYSMRTMGIINGYEDNTFKPNVHIQKRHAAALIYRVVAAKEIQLPKLSSYAQPSDVSTTHPYYKEIMYLVERGLLSFDKNGAVNPNMMLTRGEMANILATIFKLESKTTTTFSDVIGTPYEKAVGALYANGITTGYEDHTFRLHEPLTRAHYTVFIYRAIHKQTTEHNTEEKPSPNEEELVPVETLPIEQVEVPPNTYSPHADVESGYRTYPNRPNLAYIPLPKTAVPKEEIPFTIKPLDTKYYGIEFTNADIRILVKNPPKQVDIAAYEKRAKSLQKTNTLTSNGTLTLTKDSRPYEKLKEIVDLQAANIGITPAEFVAAYNYVVRTGNFYNGGRYYMYQDYVNHHILLGVYQALRPLQY